MDQSGKTFRVFISSTFSDLKAERNAIQEKVFPRLRTLCQQHGDRFQAIDLRWGVSEEASLDQQAMSICLGEIVRCQQVSPRPNFLVLLGDRYGWQPPPSQIPEPEFALIREAIQDDGEKELLKQWYSLDNNAVPPEWRLLPRLKGGLYERYENWQPVEAQLQSLLARAVEKLNFSARQRLAYTASATEQEISAGALLVEDAPEHVLCFFRSIDGLPEQFSLEDFLVEARIRLAHEFPAGIPAACEQAIRPILEMDPGASAKDCYDHIQDALLKTASATLEAEVLNVIQQVLVDVAARDFINLDEKLWVVDKEGLEKQSDLKKRLQQHLPQGVFSYSAHWTGTGITTGHLDQLCQDVYDSLARIILAEVERSHQAASTEKTHGNIQPAEELDEEGLAHHQFAESRMQFFVGRTEILANIASYLQDSQNRSLAITGVGGSGKSALVARAIQQTQETIPGAEIVYRFIGATPGSSDGRSLLESLCHEISRRYEADEAEIPLDYRDLAPEFGKRLQLASAEKPLVLFLDSLDQLSSNHNARSLVWLPNTLPPGVSVIVTTREEDTFENLKSKSPRIEVLGGLTQAEGRELLSCWLAAAHRTLQTDQYNEVIEKFLDSQGNPLYLKLAFEEAKLWTSYQPVEHLEAGVSGIIKENMIARLKDESNHGEALVSHALGYLAASRYGLAEDELVDLLSRDVQVYQWFFSNSYHLPTDLVQQAIEYRRSYFPREEITGDTPSQDDERAAVAWLKQIRNPPERVSDFLKDVLPKSDGPRLPVVLWSRLSFDLAPYLAERTLDGSSLLNFYHRELGDVAREAYLARGNDQLYHQKLAGYFRFKADPQGDKTWAGSYPHGLGELPYHLTHAALYDEVFETLTDFTFLEHKAAEVGVQLHTDQNGRPANTYTGVLQLQEDFERALEAMSGGEGNAADRGPLIVTALETSQGMVACCPVCHKSFTIRQDMLDQKIHCPQETCRAPVKLNAFTVKRDI